MTDAVASSPSTAVAAAPAALDNRMPKGIPFIVANEFAERFCFYGINAILSAYMTKVLGYTELDASSYHSLFKWAAYFAPLIGAVVSDVFWGKFKTILTFSMSYCAGCAVVAIVPGGYGLLIGLTLVALGTGGIKPCVSTNVGDQFSSKNQHLIERAFGYFYFSINAGSSISIALCPYLLKHYGRLQAFGLPAAMMFVATFVFWLGRKRYTVVPPAGKVWFDEIKSKEGLRTVGRIAIIFACLAPWWGTWELSNGQMWTLQAESSLLDKSVGFGLPPLLAEQIQVVNGLFILGLIPIFTFGIFPLWGKLTKVTPLRKICVGFFVMVPAYLAVSHVETCIQAGQTVSVWWQFLGYVILTMSEVLVSITALEFAYTQAPLKMKSFIMALFLLSISTGNLMNAIFDRFLVKEVHVDTIAAGEETWVTTPEASAFIVGQKIDFKSDAGLTYAQKDPETGKVEDAKLLGTFLVETIDAPGHRLALMDRVDRKPVVSKGSFDASKTEVSTYKLVGPAFFDFYAGLMVVMGLIFIGVAYLYKEKSHYRDESAA